MDNSVIFFLPITKGLRELKKHMEEDENIEIYEMDNPLELNQLIATMDSTIVLTSDVKKCAKFLAENKKVLKQKKSKVVLLSKKEIPPKSYNKLTQWGLTDAIIEPISPKSLIYKVYLHLKAIKEEGPEKKEIEIKDHREKVAAEKIDTQSIMRVEKLITDDGSKSKTGTSSLTPKETAPIEEQKEDKKPKGVPLFAEEPQNEEKKKKKEQHELLFEDKNKAAEKKEPTAKSEKENEIIKDKQRTLELETEKEKKKKTGLIFEESENTEEETLPHTSVEEEKKKDKGKKKKLEMEIAREEKKGRGGLLFDEEKNEEEEEPISEANLLQTEIIRDKSHGPLEFEENKEKKKKRIQLDLSAPEEIEEEILPESDIQLDEDNRTKKKSSIEFEQEENKTKKRPTPLEFETEDSLKKGKKNLDMEKAEGKNSKKKNGLVFDDEDSEEEDNPTDETDLLEKEKKKAAKNRALLFDIEEKKKKKKEELVLDYGRERDSLKKERLLEIEQEKAKKKKKEHHLQFEDTLKKDDETPYEEFDLNEVMGRKKRKSGIEIEQGTTGKKKGRERLFEEAEKATHLKYTAPVIDHNEEEKVEDRSRKLIFENEEKKKKKSSKELQLEAPDIAAEEKEKIDESNWDDIDLKRQKDNEEEEENGEIKEGDTIDYSKKEREKYEETTIDYRQFKKKKWGEEEKEQEEEKKITLDKIKTEENEKEEEEWEEMFPDINPKTFGIEHSIAVLQLYQSLEPDKNQEEVHKKIFDKIAQSIFNEKRGNVKFFSNISTMGKLIYPPGEEPSNGPDVEIFETRLPQWSDPTFQNNIINFAYPYFEGTQSLGVAVCSFTNTIKNESDCKQVETILENARGIYLSKLHIQGETGKYDKEKSKSTPKSGGLFGKLFQRKKK